MRGDRVQVIQRKAASRRGWAVTARDHTGKRHIKAFYSQAEAEGYATTLRKEVLTEGTRSLALSYEDRRDASTALDMLKPFPEASLLDAVRFYVDYRKQNEKSCTVKELIDFFIFEKEGDGLSKGHIRTTTLQFDRFALAFGKRTVSTLNFAEIKDWLHRMQVKTITKMGYRRALKSLFNYAKKRKYTSINPVDDVDLPKPQEEPIEIFTVGELHSLLKVADPETLPFLAIGGFAGLRSAEIFRLNWQDIRWDQGTIEISALIAKTGQRRFVPIQPSLVAWLKPIAKLSGPVITETHQKTFYRHVKMLSERAGVPWKHNALRHSYASYRTAITKDVNGVAWEMGNSAAIIFKHYREIVLPRDAEAYWNISPESEPEAAPLAQAA